MGAAPLHCPTCGQALLGELDVRVGDDKVVHVGWTDATAVLTKVQAAIMGALVRARDGRRVCTMETLYETAWGLHECDYPIEKTIQVHMTNIRRRLDGLGLSIRNVRAVGYCLEARP